MFFKLLIIFKKSWIGRYILNNRVAKIYSGIAKGYKRYGGIGIIGLIIKDDKKEVNFIKSLDFLGQTVYDVGANFGAFSLFFIDAVGKNGSIVAFDPLPVNCEDILRNVILNKLDVSKLTIIDKGLGAFREKRIFNFDPDNTSRASFDKKIGKEIKNNNSIEIEIDSLDSLIEKNNLKKPDFVKIDVEGLEFDVLQGMKVTLQNKPKLFIEIHGADKEQKIANVTQVVELLAQYNYDILHVESRQNITFINAAIAKEGHLFCK